MEYSQESLVLDFAERTRSNLELVAHEAQAGNASAFEVTQLINSLLGLLVFPRERFLEDIPETPLQDLSGWMDTAVRFEAGTRPKTLRELIRVLRNGVAHFNIEFFSEKGQVVGVRVANMDRNGLEDAFVQMPIGSLRSLVLRFMDYILNGRAA